VNYETAVKTSLQKIGLKSLPLTGDIVSYAATSSGSFPGAKVFSLMAKFEMAEKEEQIVDLIDKIEEALNGIIYDVGIKDLIRQLFASKKIIQQ